MTDSKQDSSTVRRPRWKVGDAVRCERDVAPSGTWQRYAGRDGWIVVVHRESLPERSYVEIGVCFERRYRPGARFDAWFLPSELVPR